jgi:D-arabinonate dehydratase
MFTCKQLGLENRGIHVLDLNNKAILMQAIAAVDLALWDAMGKFTGLPVHKLLGGYRDKVPVIAIGGYYSERKTEDDLRREVLRYRASGLAGLKLKVGALAPADDADRARLVRETAGEEFILACDANQAWTVSQAIEFCRLTRDLNIRWLEEPVQWFDQLQGLKIVRTQGRLPVTAGQGEISRFGCRDLVLAEAVDILNVDATIAGGVTEWRKIAAMASMLNISMGHHEEPQVALHLLASIPHGLYVEIFPDPERDPMWFDLPVQQPRIFEGFMHLNGEPGFGISLRQDVVERYDGNRIHS